MAMPTTQGGCAIGWYRGSGSHAPGYASAHARKAAFHLSALTFPANGIGRGCGSANLPRLGPEMAFRPTRIAGFCMTRVKSVALGAFLVGAPLLGCASDPAPHDFTLVGQRPAKAQEAGNTIAAAEAACK